MKIKLLIASFIFILVSCNQEVEKTRPDIETDWFYSTKMINKKTGKADEKYFNMNCSSLVPKIISEKFGSSDVQCIAYLSIYKQNDEIKFKITSSANYFNPVYPSGDRTLIAIQTNTSKYFLTFNGVDTEPDLSSTSANLLTKEGITGVFSKDLYDLFSNYSDMKFEILDLENNDIYKIEFTNKEFRIVYDYVFN